MSLSKKLYVSRTTILQMLNDRNIDATDFNNFSQEELELMYNTNPKLTPEINPIDMVFEDKCIIKYVMQPKLRAGELKGLAETIIKEGIAKNGSTLIFIIRDTMKMEDQIELYFENLYQKHNVFVQMFYINKLMFNVTHHKLVPKHTIVDEETKKQLMTTLNLEREDQFQIIKKNDQVSKYLGMRTGQLCKILRFSPTYGEFIVYRLCEL